MQAPEGLRELHQWINWEYRGEEKRKVPLDPNGGRNAKVNDPLTWGTFDEALSTGRSMGFVFRDCGGLFGIDLDGCIVDGEIQPWALEVLGLLPTYAEISPSGTGLKVYGRGEAPGTTGKKIAVEGVRRGADKAPAIEAYDHGRYFAFTGEHYPESPSEIVECQSGLDTVFAKYWPKRSAAPPGRGLAAYVPPAEIVESSSAWSAEKRAAAYLDRLPPAVDGSGGHNQTFRAACVLVLGFGLDIEPAFRLLSAWNERCLPPWSDKDLWHKLADANKRDGERGFLLREYGRYEGPDVDLRALMASVQGGDGGESAIAPAVADGFPVECLRVGGLIGDIVDYTLRTSAYPQPELALAAAIALVATITGRKVRDQQGTRTNIYVMGLGPPAGGKEHARKVNKDLLAEVAPNLLGPESIASSAGMLVALDSSPAMLFQVDEIGRLFSTINSPKNPHLWNIGSQLLKLYSSSDSLFVGDAYADQTKVKRIQQPHMVIYGTSTPDTFWQSLTAENVSEGLVGRFLVFDSAAGYVMPQRKSVEPVPASILDRLRWWASFHPGSQGGGNLSPFVPAPVTVPFAHGVYDRLYSHQEAISRRRIEEQTTTAAIWSRCGEKAGKLALLFACSRSDCHKPASIEMRDADLAIRISNWLTRKMLRKIFEHVSENENEAKIKRVLRKISDGMKLNELCRQTQFLRDQRERRDILEHLQATGQILIWEEKPSSGRPTTYVKKLV